jgi:hypothetical protein
MKKVALAFVALAFILGGCGSGYGGGGKKSPNYGTTTTKTGGGY